MYVTDAHPLIWSANQRFSLLSKKALRAFQKADDGDIVIYVPSVVLLEAAILEKKNKIKLQNGFEKWAENLIRKNGFSLTDIDIAVISRSVGYNFNDDPFDRLIVATAVELDLPLITRDDSIVDSNLVEVHW
jgi:PIN domain nuclease of toxin-antitoxin system